MTDKLLRAELGQQALESYLHMQEDAPASAVPRRDPAVPIPLTFAQQQIWLHAQLAPDTPLYNEPFTIHRRGPLDIVALKKSIEEIVRRHEAWRTSFSIIDGEPLQIVHPPFAVDFPIADLRNLTSGLRQSEALRLAREDARKPFDLTKCPLFRLRLIRLEEEEYRLAITAHHMIFDGVTGYQVFLPELVKIYEELLAGKPSRLPELDFQYGDYAVWQRNFPDQGDLGEGISYWREHLGGEIAPLKLPADRPRPAVQTFQGALESFSFPATLSQELEALSRDQGATLFMALLAAFNVLLYRYSEQEDIRIGSITAGRDVPGTEKLLGFFLNTVVFRTDLSGTPSFRDLLTRVRQATLSTLAHDDVPLDQVVREVHPGRDLSPSPLFQVLLSFEPSLTSVGSGWDLTAIDVDTGTSKFDLCLVLDDREKGFEGRIIYSTDLFDAETISRMVGHWRALLESIVANPDCPIHQLSIISREEKQQIVALSSGPRRDHGQTPVHELVAQQSTRTPDAVAVSCGEHSITYADLDRRSNQLAHYLRANGVKQEIPVALCVERSIEMMVGIFGILKAGGAYVPLDTNHPQERLEYLLRDCGTKVLLTQKHLPFREQSAEGMKVVCLGSDWNRISQYPGESPDLEVNGGDLAYIIYTSGSTGKPKGVAVEHRSLSASTQARIEYYEKSVGNYLLLSPIGFDSSIAVIFHTLCTGGTLVMPDPEFSWTANELANLISGNQICSMLCVPSVYRELLELSDECRLASLRTVVVAGESCPRQIVSLHEEQFAHVPLYNEYGPTEATVWSTVYRCDGALSESSVPIGKPIENTSTYVLDRWGQLTPVGIAGELHIGGAGLARGYWRDSKLTKQKFVTANLDGIGEQRLYKTGDLARLLPTGDLEFLGRVDQQVKIRGLRIETREIESSLLEHPDVRDVAVSPETDKTGQVRLVAYVVARREYATSTAELRAFLKSRLPAYMVPAVFVLISTLPRSANGKLDRLALAAEGDCSSTESFAVPPPRDFSEARLLAIWKQVLRRDDINIRQDFFELGGHSLLAAKLLARIEADFERNLSLAFIFQAPTVELMAELLRNPDESLRARAIVPIQPHGVRPPLFWVRGGPRFRLLADKLGPDQPLLGVDLPFSDAAKFRTPYNLEQISEYLVRAVREVQPHGPYYVAGLCVNAVIAYEMARQLSEAGEEVALVAMFDGHNNAYYKHPLRDGRYTGRIRYHLSNLFQSNMRESSAYLLDRLDEARRKIERTVWQLSSTSMKNGNNDRPHNTDFVVHPAFHRYEPQPYAGKVMLLQSSDWPEGPYFDFKLGWQDLAQGGVEFHRIPGDHPSMFTAPNVDIVAAKLKGAMQAVLPEQSLNTVVSAEPAEVS